MIEGWDTNDYVIFFDKKDLVDISLRYEIEKYLPGFKIIGLRGWDDFIVVGRDEKCFTIPTIPIDAIHLAPFDYSVATRELRSDPRVCGKIKWYTKPIVFGGDPNIGENLIWVTLEQHIELVKWWNQLYLSMKNPANEQSR